jgi:nucleotide-binding universal stress UspA family protein
MTSQRIIVGVDSSTGARAALEWAVDECHLRGCTLVVLHALDGHDGQPAGDRQGSNDYNHFAEQLLTRRAADASARRPGVAVTTLLSHDLPAETLIDLSADVEMVVVGTRGSNGFTSSMLGSVSHRTAVHAHCPVAVIPQRPLLPGTDDPRRIVVGVADGHAGRLALDFARQEAHLRGGMLQAVRATEPVEALLRAAQNAQLLVVGCRHSDDRWSTRLGPVPTSVLHRAPCPVIVVGATHRARTHAGVGATSINAVT